MKMFITIIIITIDLLQVNITRNNTNIHIHTHIYIYVCMCVYIWTNQAQQGSPTTTLAQFCCTQTINEYKEYAIPLFYSDVRPNLWSIQPPGLWLAKATWLEIRQPELKPEQSSPRNSEIQNVNSHTCNPFYVLIVWWLINHGEKFYPLRARVSFLRLILT